MEQYGNNHGSSGVKGFEIHRDFIKVWFVEKKEPYTYSTRGIGRRSLSEMKAYARSGKGLATYISQNVHDKYDKP